MRRPELLAHLRCPETRLPLRRATADELAAFNRRVTAGTMVNSGGERVTEVWTEALVRADGKVFYPVQDGVPQLLVEAGVENDGF